jgi:hypothetical protein
MALEINGTFLVTVTGGRSTAALNTTLNGMALVRKFRFCRVFWK